MYSPRRFRLFLVALLSLSPFASSVASAGRGAWTGHELPGGNVVALAINPQNPAVLYAGTSAGLFKSSNEGESWAATAYLSSVLSVAVDPFGRDRVYVGSPGGGVFRSLDGGASWTPAGSELQGQPVAALTVDPTDGDKLYAGSNNGTFFRSIDGGQNWSPSTGPTTTGTVSSIAVDPENPATLHLAAGTVFKSTDTGATWRRTSADFTATVIAIDPKTPLLVYAGGIRFGNSGTDPGIFRSDDGGETWTLPTRATHLGIVTAIAIDPVRPSVVYAGSVLFLQITGPIGVGVSVSQDRGATWRSFNDGDPRMGPSFVRALVIDRTGRRLHAATNRGVFDHEVVRSFSMTLPAAASLHGVPPAFFHSDVVVFNDSAGRTAAVTATYRCTNGGCGSSPRTFSIPPRQIVLFEDIAVSLFGAPETSGAIEFSSSEPIVVTSRLYTPARPAPTYGMLVPGLATDKAFALSSLTNLSHSADPSVGFRTNLGAFNTSDQTRVVSFSCREASGLTLGRVARQAGPHQLVQVNDPDLFRELNVSRDVPAFSCVVFGEASDRIYAWASVIDNQSNDSYFVTGQDYFANETLTLPAAASLHGAGGTFFRSDVVVLNQDAQFPAEVTASYRCFLGGCNASDRTFALAPGELRIFRDAVGDLFALPESGGSVEFVSNRPIAVGSRLYTPDVGRGTVGMFVPGLTLLEANPSQVLALVLRPGGLSPGSRVNVGVFNPDDRAQIVTLRLFTSSGVLLGQHARLVEGQKGAQVNDIFRAIGIGGIFPSAYCLVEGDGARPIFAYAAVIDNESQDPIFVTGQDDPESPPID